jgi:hypothetical protein
VSEPIVPAKNITRDPIAFCRPWFQAREGRSNMPRRLLLAAMGLLALAVSAASTTDFSGTWEFNPQKSENIGMMAQAKMTVTIRQTRDALDVDAHTSFQGQESALTTHYDLHGKPVPNQAPMAGPSETVSKWQDGKIVTTWTSQGAVAGSQVVRLETRSLSSDAKTMKMESTRGSNPPVVMVFDKKQ